MELEGTLVIKHYSAFGPYPEPV